MGCSGSKGNANANGKDKPRKATTTENQGDSSETRHGSVAGPSTNAGVGHAWKEDNWQQDIQEIWNRNIQDLPVHTDIPRLGKKIEVYSPDMTPLLQSAPGMNNPQIVRLLLQTLCFHLKDDSAIQDAVQDRFYQYVKETAEGDIGIQLKDFLVACTVGSKIEKVLKCCHQKIIFPGFYSMKNRIADTYPFKDQRNTWKISILLQQDGSVKVVHRKEQVNNDATDGEEKFSFVWSLAISLSSDLNKIESSVVTVEALKLKKLSPADAEKMTTFFTGLYPNITIS